MLIILLIIIIVLLASGGGYRYQPPRPALVAENPMITLGFPDVIGWSPRPAVASIPRGEAAHYADKENPWHRMSSS